MKVAIIDDEPLAVELLVHYVRQIPFLELAGTWNSAVEAERELQEAQPDLLLLDIQMPELTGMQLARMLPRQTMVIFTTAFPQYALEGYQVNSVDYLLKPIDFPLFSKAIQKAWERHCNMTPDRAFIYVKSDYQQVRIYLRDIRYIESLKDYVKIHLLPSSNMPSSAGGSTRHVVTMISMKTLEAFLPTPQFMRVHRSFIVQMPLVCRIDKQGILLDDVCIPVSDTYRETVMQFVREHTP